MTWPGRPSRVAIACACLGLCLAQIAAAQDVRERRGRQVISIPTTIPLFPLPEVVLFPGLSRQLVIYEPRYRTMVADALKGDRIIGMVLLQPGHEADYEGRPPIFDTGCVGHIAESQQLADGRYTIILQCLAKFRVVSEDQSRPYRLARIEVIPEVPKGDELAPLSTAREKVARLLINVLPLGAEPPPQDFSDALYVNTVASNLNIPETTRQQLLEDPGVLARAQALVEMLENR
jgi:Lon protease-like protein